MLNFSYALNLQTEKVVGTNTSDKHTDSVNSIYQALNNNLIDGNLLKLDIELQSGETKEINLTSLGFPSVRCILLKSNNKFGYTLKNTTIDEDDYWYLVRTAFIDFNVKPSTTIVAGINAKYKLNQSLGIIKIESPPITHPAATPQVPIPTIVVQLFVIGSL